MERVPKAPILGQRPSVTRERSNERFQRQQRIIAGRGISLSRGPNGVLVELADLSGHGGGSAQADFPWKVRWYPHDIEDDSKGEWQVYAPIGSLVVNYGGSYSAKKSYAGMCVNDAGKGEDGNALFGWFRIPDPTNADAEISVSDKASKSWAVRVYIKPWARFRVATSIGDYGKVAWVETIATIGQYDYKVDDKTHTEHWVTQSLSKSITENLDNTDAFAIDYELANEFDANSGVKVSVINQAKMLGRLQKVNIEPFEITDKTSVWVKIKHENTEFDMTLETTDPGKSNDDQTCYKIYDLDGNVITADLRKSVTDLPFYTNKADSGGSS